MRAEFLACCMEENVDTKSSADVGGMDSGISLSPNALKNETDQCILVCVCCLNICSDQFATTAALQIKEIFQQK